MKRKDFRLRKKGSLNLSIEAIVIVVIAFVVLGLGLGFVRNQFKSMQETTVSVQEQIKQQIMEDLKTGDKKLSFPQSEIKMNKNEAYVTAFGVKNMGDASADYTISVEFVKGDPVILLTSTESDFIYTETTGQLAPTESRLINLRFSSGSTNSGTGLYRVRLTEGTVPYDEKTFFITVMG